MSGVFENAKKTAKMVVSSAENSKGLKSIKELHIEDVPQIRATTRLFTANLKDAKIELLGPLPDGNTLLRIMAKTRFGQKPLKAHVEISLAPDEALKFVMKGEFYQHLSAMKLSQYIGYVAEDLVMEMAKNGTLHKMMYLPKFGRNTAQAFNRAIIPESAFSLQYGSGQGIDFFAELVPPPPNQWVTIDVKATLRKAFDPWGTPKTPPLSKAQKKAMDNLYSHVKESLASYRKGNPYNLTKEQRTALLRFEEAYEESLMMKTSVITAYELKLGMTEGFNLASNQKYPTMMVLKEIK
ncbi:hypothetical protein [Serratia fonticola]